MRWYLIAPGVLAALVALVPSIGMLLPRTRVVTRRRSVDAPPPRVWRLITDVGAYADWRPDVDAVELLPPVNGRVAWRERGGRRAVTRELLRAEPPWRVAIGVAGRARPLPGEWQVELAPDGDATLVTVVARGEAHHPVRRVVSRLVDDEPAAVERWLAALEGAVGRRRPSDPALPAPSTTETAGHGV